MDDGGGVARGPFDTHLGCPAVVGKAVCVRVRTRRDPARHLPGVER